MLGHTLVGAALVLATTSALAWKWQLGVRRVAVFTVALAIGWSFAVGALDAVAPMGLAARSAVVWALTLVAAATFLAFRFYRDPERTPPGRDDVVVSPADGEVVYVRRSTSGMLPVSDKGGRRYHIEELTKTPLEAEEAIVIGIGMNFSDVHVNRSPIEGTVVLKRRFPGSFGSLRRPEMILANERATTIVERDGFQVALVQIASRLVRKIVVYVHEGERVALGQRVGVIRLGSQVDLVLPARDDLEVCVQPGQHVTAGESIVARLGRPASTGQAQAPSAGRRRTAGSRPRGRVTAS